MAIGLKKLAPSSSLDFDSTVFNALLICIYEIKWFKKSSYSNKPSLLLLRGKRSDPFPTPNEKLWSNFNSGQRTSVLEKKISRKGEHQETGMNLEPLEVGKQ